MGLQIAAFVPLLLCLQFDAAWRSESSVGACGAVFSSTRIETETTPLLQSRFIALGARYIPRGLCDSSGSAEYESLIFGLLFAVGHAETLFLKSDNSPVRRDFIVQGDCRVVIDQMSGLARPRLMRARHAAASALVVELTDAVREKVGVELTVSFQLIPRRDNAVADALAGEAMRVVQATRLRAFRDLVVRGSFALAFTTIDPESCEESDPFAAPVSTLVPARLKKPPVKSLGKARALEDGRSVNDGEVGLALSARDFPAAALPALLVELCHSAQAAGDGAALASAAQRLRWHAHGYRSPSRPLLATALRFEARGAALLNGQEEAAATADPLQTSEALSVAEAKPKASKKTATTSGERALAIELSAPSQLLVKHRYVLQRQENEEGCKEAAKCLEESQAAMPGLAPSVTTNPMPGQSSSPTTDDDELEAKKSSTTLSLERGGYSCENSAAAAAAVEFWSRGVVREDTAAATNTNWAGEMGVKESARGDPSTALLDLRELLSRTGVWSPFDLF